MFFMYFTYVLFVVESESELFYCHYVHTCNEIVCSNNTTEVEM